MKKYKHLFFDLDHTLWDFEKNSSDTLMEIFQKFELSDRLQSTFSDFHDIYKKVNHSLWEDYRKDLISKEDLRGVRFYNTLGYFNYFDREASEQIGDYYVNHSPHKTNLLPNALDVLQYLKHKDYQMHIITNGFEEVQHIKLDKSLLRPYFVHVVTSERAGVKKPERDIFRHAIEIANSSLEDSIMIGDSYGADILGAKEFGMDQVYFCEKRKWEGGDATYKISNLEELKSIL